MTTSSGASTCLLQYDLYGASLFGASATNPCLGGGSQLSTLGYQYTSRDPGTGDYAFGGRTYDPAKGAFATPDAFSPGSTATDLSVGSDPLTADAYNYVNGDPVNHIDPTGHNPCATEGVGPDGCTTSENRALGASDHGASIAGPWTPTRTYHTSLPLPTFTPGTYHLVQMNSEQVLERALAGYDARMAAAAQQRLLAEQALERQQAQELADARQ